MLGWCEAVEASSWAKQGGRNICWPSQTIWMGFPSFPVPRDNMGKWGLVGKLRGS